MKIISPTGETGEIIENGILKSLRSPKYNWNFRKDTGKFIRWGENENNDPKFSPFGPEILDLEVGTICHGIDNKPCPHCYKSNFGTGKNMSLETFKEILHKIPKTLTQIAFGVGDLDGNPDLFEMFRYCRENNHNEVVPNLTINGWNLTDEQVKRLSKYCGAIAVSRYSHNVDACYNAIRRLLDSGITQTNIHALLSKETYLGCWKVLSEVENDPRLKGLNALVFLLYKPKGRGKKNDYSPVSFKEFKLLIDSALERKIRMGFDSCSAPFFLKSVLDNGDFEIYKTYAESCESSRFSAYINVEGRYWHCSFTEDEPGWEGIDVLNNEDFLKNVWFSPETIRFRENVISQNHSIASDCYTCPTFKDLYSGEEF